MAVMRVEKNANYTVMANYHLRDKGISLKAKGLLSVMLSLPAEWDYTLAGLSYISKEGIDAIRAAVNELVKAGYIIRSRRRNEAGQLRDAEYTIYEFPQQQPPVQAETSLVTSVLPCHVDTLADPLEPVWEKPMLEKPMLERPTQERPTLENPTQLNTNQKKKEIKNTDNFDYGDWIIRESKAPDGYSPMEDVRFHVGDGWSQPKPILCVNIPNHYEFKKTDSDGNPLAGVKFRLEDEKGKELGIYESDKDGLVQIKDLLPGNYIIREIETLEGYTVSGEVIKLKLDEYYVSPEKLRQFVNYTTIQTGVHMAVTGIMWVGLGLMAVSGTVGLIRRRRQRKTK